MLHNEYFVGRNAIKFRRQKNWTREEFAAKVQLLGCYMTRDIIANIETHRRSVTDKQIMYFAEAFGVEAGRFLRKQVLALP